jgi:L-ascorbate metabolism protein UlaG (beta-lactamase superfamily)
MLDKVTWYKQSGILWRGTPVVYVDPWDVPEGEPTADVILITHAHFDHFSEADISKLSKTGTIVVAPEDVAAQLSSGDVRAVKPGARLDAGGVAVEAVPAYNARAERKDFHPRDNNWVGYVLDLAGTRAYLAGDTDHIPEMADIDAEVAFVPIGGTYTMDADEAAAAVKDIAPKTAVPYHFGFVVGSKADAERFVKAIAPVEGRILKPRHPFEA